jgi:cell division protein FtsW (lipid II flippase)
MPSVYQINKGINRPIEFKGLKAQYIWYLGGGLLCWLILFAVLYICGVNTFLLLGIIVILGTALFMYVYRLSHKYGDHGMMKSIAKRSIPRLVRNNSRKVFTQLTAEAQRPQRFAE